MSRAKSPVFVESPQRSLIPQEPEVACPCNRLLGRLLRARVVDRGGGEALVQFLKQGIDVLRRVAHTVKGVLRLELFEEPQKRRLIPCGELMGTVVGHAIRYGVEVRSLKPDHRHLPHAEGLCRLEPGVSRHDLPGGLGDDGLAPAEALYGCGNVGDSGVVEARVAGLR